MDDDVINMPQTGHHRLCGRKSPNAVGVGVSGHDFVAALVNHHNLHAERDVVDLQSRHSRMQFSRHVPRRIFISPTQRTARRADFTDARNHMHGKRQRRSRIRRCHDRGIRPRHIAAIRVRLPNVMRVPVEPVRSRTLRTRTTTLRVRMAGRHRYRRKNENDDYGTSSHISIRECRARSCSACGTSTRSRLGLRKTLPVQFQDRLADCNSVPFVGEIVVIFSGMQSR